MALQLGPCIPHSLQEPSLQGSPAACLHHRLDARPHSVPLSHNCCNEPAEVGWRVSAGRTSPPPHLLWASPIPPSLGFHGSVWQRGVYFKVLAGTPGRSHGDTGLGMRAGSSHLLSAYSERVLSKTPRPSPPLLLIPARRGTCYYLILQIRRLRYEG